TMRDKKMRLGVVLTVLGYRPISWLSVVGKGQAVWRFTAETTLTCGKTRAPNSHWPFAGKVGSIPPPTLWSRSTAMGRLVSTDGLTDEQQEILKLVRQFVEKEIIPVATELEHA